MILLSDELEPVSARTGSFVQPAKLARKPVSGFGVTMRKGPYKLGDAKFGLSGQQSAFIVSAASV